MVMAPYRFFYNVAQVQGMLGTASTRLVALPDKDGIYRHSQL
jgi:hypothetical protein